MEQLLDQLQELGFFRFVATGKIAAIRKEIAKCGFLFVEGTKRGWHADAEDLAEGGVAAFLEDHRRDLLTFGLDIGEVSDDFNIGGHYGVLIDGEYFLMYSDSELESDDFWQLTQERAFGMINTLLAKKKSEEQIYSLYSGNDAHAILLTSPMQIAIKKCKAISEREVPLKVKPHKATKKRP